MYLGICVLLDLCIYIFLMGHKSGARQGAILGVRMSKWLKPKMGPRGHNLRARDD